MQDNAAVPQSYETGTRQIVKDWAYGLAREIGHGGEFLLADIGFDSCFAYIAAICDPQQHGDATPSLVAQHQVGNGLGSNCDGIDQ